jgi:hypothetical protein
MEGPGFLGFADSLPIVDSVFGRTAAVVAVAGDYTSALVSDDTVGLGLTVKLSLGILNTAKAPLASPTFTGVPAAPTAAPGTNTTQLATTAFVAALGALKVDAAFTPGEPNDWDGVPTTVQNAIDRIAAVVATLSLNPIP